MDTRKIKCVLCKNFFFKIHIKDHYENCKKQLVKQSNSINSDKSEKSFNPPHMQIEKYIQPEIINYNDEMLNHFFKEYEKLFHSFVNGKTVALVGPSQSLIGTNKGNIIDKFDLVVRLNKSLPLSSNIKNDIGTKTDIIYNSLNTSDFPGQNNLNPELYKKYGVQYVCTSYPFNHNIFHDDILNYVYKYKFALPLKVMDDNKYKKFEKLLNTRLYTGTCAIMDLLSYPIKYLYITGIDFYQTKYYSEYRKISNDSLEHNRNNIIHQRKPQMDYLKNVSLFDNRIILDDYLDKMLYYDYYKVLKKLLSLDKNQIFNFGDIYLQKYFEMKISPCTFTKNNFNCSASYEQNHGKTNSPYLVFTDNKYYSKNINEYCIFITNDKNILSILNNNLESKKFIGNFYYTENKNSPSSIYLTSVFLSNLKSILSRIGIGNCNTFLAILLSIMLYLPDKHYFSYNEVLNNWKLNMDEKKFVLFLIKKKVLILI